MNSNLKTKTPSMELEEELAILLDGIPKEYSEEEAQEVIFGGSEAK